MTWLPILLGLALGGGALLSYQGFRRLTNKDLDEAARRSGFWFLNGGLVLMAVSMALMVQAGSS